MASCCEVSQYFGKRAILEDEYGKSMLKLAKSTAEDIQQTKESVVLSKTVGKGHSRS